MSGEAAAAEPLERLGLGSHVGDVVFPARVKVPRGADVRLALPGAQSFVRVRWNGHDLGVCAWTPYEWGLPADASEGLLEIVVSTSVVDMLGDPKASDCGWLRGWPRDLKRSAPLAPVWSVLSRTDPGNGSVRGEERAVQPITPGLTNLKLSPAPEWR